MKDLELILPTKQVLCFSIGDPLNILKALGEADEIYNDPEFNQVSYVYSLKYGLEFLFKNNRLKTVFIFLNTTGKKGFNGSLSLLPNSFFNSFDQEVFIKSLTELGYQQHEKAYPFSIDMLNESLRIRYNFNPRNPSIIVDNGNMIR